MRCSLPVSKRNGVQLLTTSPGHTLHASYRCQNCRGMVMKADILADAEMTLNDDNRVVLRLNQSPRNEKIRPPLGEIESPVSKRRSIRSADMELGAKYEIQFWPIRPSARSTTSFTTGASVAGKASQSECGWLAASATFQVLALKTAAAARMANHDSSRPAGNRRAGLMRNPSSVPPPPSEPRRRRQSPGSLPVLMAM